MHFVVGRYVKRGLIEEAWGRGIVHIKLIGDLPLGSGSLAESRQAARYVAPYTAKAVDDSDGGRGEADPDCCCSPIAIERYRTRLNGALAERLDIVIEISPPSRAEVGGPPGEASEVVRKRVVAARERQERRLGPGFCNADAAGGEVSRFSLSEVTQRLLDRRLGPFDRLGGARLCRVLRLAQTVADLAGVEAVSEEQMLEAPHLGGGKRG